MAVGPGEDEAWVQPSTAHGVIAGAIGAAHHDGQLGHSGIGHGLDHLGAVLDHPLSLRLGADHEPGGVVQKQQRRTALVAQLDELRGLARALGRDRSVVADQATGMAANVQVAANRLGVELAFEGQEIRAVGDAGDDFLHVIGFLRVVGDQSQ
ncbi:hypothetical protein D3C78_1218490 [compost metagenome]